MAALRQRPIFSLIKYAKGMATRCCGMPDTNAIHNVLLERSPHQRVLNSKHHIFKPHKLHRSEPLHGVPHVKHQYEGKHNGEESKNQEEQQKWADQHIGRQCGC